MPTSPSDADAPASSHPDPLSGEPDAHPVGVGLGALGAGAVATAIGAVVGPVGALIGAAIGAVARGLAGKEVARSGETTDPDPDPVPNAPATSAGRTAVPIHRPDAPARAFASDYEESGAQPLPTASSGLITPQEDSFFADSADPDSALLAESPLPAAFAVTAAPEDRLAEVEAGPVFTSHLGTEHLIREGAYYRYLHRRHTHQPGDELGDWVAAEQAVLRG